MSKLKNLPHRRWDIISEQWVPHIPEINIHSEFPSPTFWKYSPLTQISSTLKDGDEFENIPGLRECVFREAVIFNRKHIYCRSAALSSAAQGFSTFSYVLSYDAALYAARSYLCLLGVINFGRQSKFYLDVFGERTEKVHGKKTIKYDMNVVHHLDSHLTHEMIWKLCARMRDTFKSLSMPDQVVQKFRNIDLSQVSNFRNNLLYDAAAWVSLDDYEHCDITNKFGSLSVMRVVSGLNKDEIEERSYFDLSKCLGEVLGEMFVSLSEFVPAVRSEADALSNWSLGVAA